MSQDKTVLLLASLGLLILTFTFIPAAFTPPTNWDSLSYHLPRQLYWIQQQQVGFFPTHDWRMLTMPPLAEYLGAHLMLLSGGDQWLNLVQWFSLALCAVSVSLIVRELGGSARAQTCAALLALSIPTAALQATNTKNDVLTAFLLCAFGWVSLRVFRQQRYSVADALLAGSTAGLLILSKLTGVLMGAPLMLWAAWVFFRASGSQGKFWRNTTYGAAAALLIVTGHFSRVQAEFGTITGPRVSRRGYSLQNTLHTPAALASNLLRNLGMHLGTPSRAANKWIAGRIHAAHEWLGISPDDPRTTFGRSQPFGVSLDLTNEDRAKAPLHVLLTLAAGGALLVCTVRKRTPGLTFFLWTPFLGFALFCYLIAWQEWHSRLHIPLLCLGSAVAAFLFTDRLPKTIVAFAAVSGVVALFAIALNEAKPLVGSKNVFSTSKREMRYRPPETRDALKQTVAVCQELQPRVIGIVANRWEYSLLRQLWHRFPTRPHFVKLNAVYGKRSQPEPDVVIRWLVEKASFAETVSVEEYAELVNTELLSVYAKKPASRMEQ